MAGRIAGITIEIGGDTTKLQSALKGVDAQLRTTRTSLRDVDRMLKLNPTSTQLLTQKQQLLKQSIQATKERLTTLKDALAQMDAKGVDKNSKEYQNLQREIMATEGKLKSLEQEYSRFASVTGAQMQAVGAKMQELGGKITAAGQAVTRDLTAPIAALAGVSVKSFAEVDKGMDAIVKKTGATGDALNEMKDSAKNLATSIPTDFQTAGDAVGQVSTRFKLTGDNLENVAGQFVKFAKLNNTDVTTSVNTVQSAMAAFGVQTQDVGSFLDTLNAVGQNTGADMNRLASEMTTNAASLKAMGYSASDAANFLGQLSVNGIDSSQVMSGLKKAFSQATKEGKPLDQALAELQDTMKNADTDTEAYAAALDLFGNRAGPALASAIRDGRLSLEMLGTSLEDNVGNIDKTFENTIDPIDKFKMAVNQAKVAGASLGGSLLNTLTPMIEKLQVILTNLGDKFNSLSPRQQEMIVKFGLIAAAIGPVIMIVGKLTSGIGLLVSGIGTAVSKLTALGTGAGLAVNPIVACVAAIGALGVATYKSYESYKKNIEAQHQFTAEQKEAIDAVNQSVDAYNAAQQAAAEKNATLTAEFGHVRELKDEYNSLVDSNGKIAEGDKAHAEVIINELAQALGLEKSEVEDLIGKNGQLSGSIDKVIAKKEAQAYLDANYDSYVEAIKLQTDSNNKLATAVQAVDDAEAGVAAAQANLASAQTALNNARASGARNTKQLANDVSKAQIALDSEKGKLSEAQAAVDKYSNASKDAANKITNYRNLEEAAVKGSTKKMSQALTVYQNDLKTATTASKEELTKQARDAQSKLASVKKAYDQGKITKSAVDAAQKRADAAAKEAKKVGVSMDKLKTDVSDKTAAAKKAADKNIKGIKADFPVSLGQLLTGTLVNISTTVKKAAGGGKDVKQTAKKTKFARGYTNPLLFTSPSVVPIAGDRFSANGGELMYGKNNLMNDIKKAVGGGGSQNVINVTVNGSENPEAWADRFVREYKLQTRMS